MGRNTFVESFDVQELVCILLLQRHRNVVYHAHLVEGPLPRSLPCWLWHSSLLPIQLNPRWPEVLLTCFNIDLLPFVPMVLFVVWCLQNQLVRTFP